MKIWLVCFVLALCQYCSAGLIYSKNEKIYYACNYQVILTATFCPPTQFNCSCVDMANMGTLLGCAERYGADMDSFTEFNIDYCMETYLVPINKLIILEAIDYYNQNHVTSEDIPNFNISVPIDKPLYLNETIRQDFEVSYDKFLGNYNTSAYYSSGMLGYWCLVLLIAAVANWSKVLFPNLVFKLTGPVVNTYRKYITLPAVHRKRNEAKSFFGYFSLMLIPSRYESLVILGFLGMTIGFNASLYKWSPEDPVFPVKYIALSRYVADRSGITGTFMIPLLIVFAGRNNFLQYLTRMHFTTFITYHKWIARISTALIIIHSVTFSIVYWEDYYEDMKETYVVYGVLGTVAMGLLVGQTFLFMRRNQYEIFVLIHIILSALFIVGTWIHVIDLFYGPFMFASVAVWVFDRVVRIARLLWFGVANANVTLVSDETLRIVVPKPKYWKIIPGGYAFIYFLRPTCFWQSHPFTFTEHPSNPNEVVLYCKVKGGITHGLYQYLGKFPNKTATIKVSLEGPYGDSAPVARYDTALFIAGGNGIPGIYSEVVALANKPKKEDQVVKLIWVIREYKSLMWFHEELMYLKNTKVKTTVYVTNPHSKSYLRDLKGVLSTTNSSDGDIKKGYEDESGEASFLDTIKSEFEHIEFKEGRPDMENLVNYETEESPGPIAFIACGHAAMVDDIRYSVAENVTKFPTKRMDFYEQIQIWA